jgi:uncharacterized protein (TIGR02145 family)
MASEVNGNFAAVKTAVDGNAGDISTNKGKITTNTSNITTNTNGVATNVNDIATNKSDIQANAVGVSMWVRDHEGNIHPTVKIGSQVWMADNMYVTTYPDGTAIDDPSTWTDNSDDAYAYPIKKASDYEGSDDTPVAYKGDLDIKRYGLFYQYRAAVNGNTSGDAQGICPSGWHIPTTDDWDTLQVTLGANTLSRNNWNNGVTEKLGNQLKMGGKSGFSALLTGFHDTAATAYAGRGTFVYFWATIPGSYGEYRGLGRAGDGMYANEGGIDSTFGFVVRCIKN